MNKQFALFRRRKHCRAYVRPLLRMKFLFILLLACLVQVNAATYAQKVSLSVRNASLEEVFRQLKLQSGYDFLYSAQVVQHTKVSLQVKDEELVNVIEKCLKGSDLTFTIRNKTVVIKKVGANLTADIESPLQARQVSGTVTDEKGQGLPGVSVKLKGTNTGTMTDVNGKFSLNVSVNNPVLVFSYIGFNTEEVVVSQNNIANMVMKEQLSSLNQVVVVGYGTQRKANVLGAVSQVSGKELQTSPTGNLSSMLQGRLPGLVTKQPSGQPGSDGASLLVRGLNSPTSNSPLVVVDGIPRPFPNINPDEVESITILKDASSGAVYGVQAANGVILVTTKRGLKQKSTIDVHSSLSLSTNTNFPKFLNGADYAYWYDKAQEMDGVPESGRRFTQDQIDRIKNGDPKGVYANTDWFDMLFKSTAPTYVNNISLRGGNDDIKYFVSLGSYNQRGIIDRTGYDRYSIRANIDAKVAKNLNLSVNLAGQTNETKQPGLSAGLGNSYGSIFSQALMSYPYLPAYLDGKPVGSQNPGNGNQNPLAARDLSGDQNNRAAMFEGSMALKYSVPFVKGLELKMNTAYDRNYSVKKSTLMPYQLMIFNPSSETYSPSYARHALTGDAVINQWFAESWRTTVQPSIGYNNQFGKHAVSGLFLYEYIRDQGTGMSAGRRSFPITDIMDLNYGEEVIADLVKGSHSYFHRAGYVSRLSYNYDEKYLFEFTGRVDGSSFFPSDQRWGFFPAVALGWRISQEPFFKDQVSFIDDLKLRASAGKLANDNIGGQAFLKTMSLGKDPVVMIGDKLSRPLTMDRVPNLGITWETTSSYNGGFEAIMWKGLLGVELDVFYKVTNDILQGRADMPPSLGGYFPSVINSGIVDNRGFELVLTHNNHIGDFNYNIRGNVSWARNKVIRSTEATNVPDYMRQVGRPMGQKYGFIAEGLFQSAEEVENSPVFGPTLPGDVKLKDINGDGKITFDQDWVVTGRSSTPEMMFGMNLGGSYKGFDLNIFLQGAALSDVWLAGLYSDRGFYDNTFYTKPFWSDGNAPYYLVENAWRPDNTNAKYPRLGLESRSNGGAMSSWWVVNSSYLRLKSVQIGYSLPAPLMQRANIQKIRLYVSGSNLFTLSHLKYFDPEMPDVNQGYYPQQRLFEFGLNLTF
ncbi:TonB-dependent receptor [Chitinophaga defluvii]|uniref:TonB-dependent receptor n=1 Tax=Chitinophaga defluvii TaxID=3163343 RepID=A0ABV2SYZ7_9BACT